MQQHTREQRDELVRSFKASGMTQRAWCRSHGVNYHTLQYWLHHKPIQHERTQQANTSRFIEVTAPLASSVAVRLCLGSDTELVFTELPPAAYLCELARVLRRPC
jgi:transposase-like protein